MCLCVALLGCVGRMLPWRATHTGTTVRECVDIVWVLDCRVLFGWSQIGGSVRGRVGQLGCGSRKVPMLWCLGVGGASSRKGTHVLVCGSAWLCGSHATAASDPHRYSGS